MSKYLTHTAHAFLFLFITSIVIFTIYLAALGWPVLKYQLVSKWTGTEPNMMIEVLQFNECLNPLPMKDIE